MSCADTRIKISWFTSKIDFLHKYVHIFDTLLLVTELHVTYKSNICTCGAQSKIERTKIQCLL